MKLPTSLLSDHVDNQISFSQVVNSNVIKTYVIENEDIGTPGTAL